MDWLLYLHLQVKATAGYERRPSLYQKTLTLGVFCANFFGVTLSTTLRLYDPSISNVPKILSAVPNMLALHTAIHGLMAILLAFLQVLDPNMICVQVFRFVFIAQRVQVSNV